MKNIFKTFFISVLLFIPFLNSQDQFTEQTSIYLPGVYYGSIAWGDYDNDDDLDILLAGSGPSKIYRNNGNNTFTEQPISLPGVNFGSVAWGDYDNDGYLDILLTGIGGGPVSKIYRNNGNNTFTEQTSIILIGVNSSSVAWGDYDNNGDLDIVLTGYTGSSFISRIYRNNGNNTFTEQPIYLPGVNFGSVAWGDYDNDAELDILLTGYTGSSFISKIYRNNSNNTFTEQTSISLPGVYGSSVAWGDYDNDGDLDILLTGYTGSSYISKIYRNNGNNTFTEQPISLPGVSNGSVAWGDYDNDGDLDILLTGHTGSTPISKIYRNNGNNTFTEQTSISLIGVYGSSVAWGDYDNDRDLDILLAGRNGSELISKIYRNNNITANSLPSAPANLTTSIIGNDVTFSWDKSTDAETPQNGLKYNLVIGTNPNAVNVLSPMSDLSTGYRRVIGLGNANHNNRWKIKGLANGQYYWSVQAIDNAYAGSEFAQQSLIQDQFTEQTTISLTGVHNVDFEWGVGYSPNASAWGDYDNDNDLDIIITGVSSGGKISKIYRNNGNNTFTEQTSISLTGVWAGSVAWGDYDNDGDIDLLLTGALEYGGTCIAKIYRNNSDNTFTEQTSIELHGVAGGTPCWGDYDNDGYLDILLTGGDEVGHIAKMYRNNGDNTFTEQTSISLTGSYSGTITWGDYDNDGDLDILYTGWDGYNPISKIYRNNSDNTFTEQTSISLTNVRFSSAAWGDYDNDGYLDILLTGRTESEDHVSKIYRNNGDGTFTDQTSISLAGVSQGSSAWGDYDNDGDLDILLTGRDGIGQVSKIYRNNGDNTFIQTSNSFTGVYGGSAAWGDYDNDGDLDILLAGWNGSTGVSKIYRNNNITANSLPSAPANLTTSIIGNDVIFSWDKSTDAETPQNGLKYNLVVGTGPTSVNVLSPMSDRNTGYRRIINLGNVNHCNNWAIRGLPDGQYYWSIQAIDNCFAGSNFASTQSFTMKAQGTITITYPRGREIFEVGSNPIITYASIGNSGYVNLDYSTDRGITWDTIATDQKDDGDYKGWIVPNTPSSNCKLRVTDVDGDPSAVSDSLFTIQLPGIIIITCPKGGEEWEVGSNPIIEYSSIRGSGYINLDYSTDGGITWDTIAVNQIDDGDYRGWIVPNKPSENCKIRITDADGSPSAISDSSFTILGDIPVELVSFSVNFNKNKVLLEWKTATETNNKGFEVERASSSTSPGQDWEKIGYLEGAGTSVNEKTYSFSDNSLTVSGSYIYRLKQIDYAGSFEYSDEVLVEANLIPDKLSLSQNYPNPFNPSTTIRYGIPTEGDVKLVVYGILGNKAAVLVNEKKEAGSYEVIFDGSGLANGIYIYRLQTANNVQSRKMILLK